MSLDLISRDIYSQAEEEISKLENKAQEEISQLRSETQGRVELFKRNLYERYLIEKKFLEESIYGKYSREAKKIELTAQNKLLESIKREIIDDIGLLSLKELNKLLKSIYVMVKSEIKIKVVRCCRKYSNSLREVLPKSIIIKSDNIGDNFIFESSDSKEIVNISIQDLVNSLIEKKEMEIYTRLFR